MDVGEDESWSDFFHGFFFVHAPNLVQFLKVFEQI